MVNYHISILFFLLQFGGSLISIAGTVNQSIYINSGYHTTITSNTIPYKAFNHTQSFVAENARIVIQHSDTLYLTVVNNDSVPHGFRIKNYSSPVVINPGDSILQEFNAPGPSVHIFYDDLQYPNQKSLGLGGMIVVNNSQNQFYWNLKDFQTGRNDSIFAGLSVNWLQYYPDFFILNSRSNPQINSDSFARITGSVGDTIHIHVANTGQTDHSIHFHGYHAKILYSSHNPSHLNRIKDTFPCKKMETLILELVPDKTGEFPVHDHNLLAVTGGGVYPYGLFLTILIQ